LWIRGDFPVPQKARQNPYVFVNCVVSLAGAAKSPSFGGRESRPVECNGVLRSRRLAPISGYPRSAFNCPSRIGI
jgi:hypothetical protein